MTQTQPIPSSLIYDFDVLYTVSAKAIPVLDVLNAALAEIGAEQEIQIRRTITMSLAVSREMNPKEIAVVSQTIRHNLEQSGMSDITIGSFNLRKGSDNGDCN